MKDHAKSLAAGMMVPDARICTGCHNAQSPTFKAIAVIAPSQQQTEGAPLPSGSRPQAENVIDLADADQLMRVYRRRIAGVA